MLTSSTYQPTTWKTGSTTLSMHLRSTLGAVRSHWREYLMEAWGLGIFMMSAGSMAILLEHPASPFNRLLPSPELRRSLMGMAMGFTAISIIYSPWGKRSGAHINPAVTFTFFRLGRIKAVDAIFYALSQFGGGLAGLALIAIVSAGLLAHPQVNYVATRPGPDGVAVAFFAEVLISFLLMTVVLLVSNNRRINRFTGLCAGFLVAAYIALEAPLSGMSMNPARSLASAAPAGLWRELWIYFTAPLTGMLLAAELYVRVRGARHVLCAKLHHDNNARCIFRCRYDDRCSPISSEVNSADSTVN